MAVPVIRATIATLHMAITINTALSMPLSVADSSWVGSPSMEETVPVVQIRRHSNESLLPML